jgi:hypothetical protein
MILLAWHLGLGDAVVCNAIARVLAECCDQLFVPVKLDNVVTVRWMLKDLPNVSIMVVSGDGQVETTKERFAAQEGAGSVFGLGVHARGSWDRLRADRDMSFDRAFYAQAGIPFGTRWSAFRVPRTVEEAAAPSPPLKRPYAFVHDDGRYPIDRARLPDMPVVKMERRPGLGMFHWDAVARRAAEVHVIDSAPMFWLDSVWLPGRRFIHRYARKLPRFNVPRLRQSWEVLE